MWIQAIPIEELAMVCFTDAAWAVRKDGKSQGGYCIAVVPKKFLNGEEAWITLLDWKSFKFPRVVRSSLAAETCAFTDGEDQLEYVKLFLLEMVEPQALDLRKYTQIIAESGIVPLMVTDCKSLYDAIEKKHECRCVPL